MAGFRRDYNQSLERISDFDLFDRHAHDALSHMKQRLAEGFAIDFQVLPTSRLAFPSSTPSEYNSLGLRSALHLGLGNRVPVREFRRLYVRWPAISRVRSDRQFSEFPQPSVQHLRQSIL